MARGQVVWRWAWVMGAWSLLTIPAVATGRDPPEASVVQLRLSVDALSAQLRADREQTQARLVALQDERDALGRQLRAARLRSQTLDRIEREWAAQEAAHDEEARRWQVPAREAVARVRAAVLRGLPFMLEERLATLDRIEAELAGHHPDVARAMERLWRFLEEEAAMTSEIALHRQPVRIGDPATQNAQEPQLVDVLRVGLGLLYFRTFEGQVGWAVRGESGWRFELRTAPRERALIQALFEAQENNEGYGESILLLPANFAEANRG